MLSLRPYQEEAVARFAERIGKVERGGLIVLPTATGKSLVMSEIAKWWQANGKGGIGIVSHRKELVKQNADEYDGIVSKPGACAIDQGNRYKATLEDWERVRAGGVISFTVQTLQNRRMQKVSRDAIGLILVDEAHRIKLDGQYIKVREYFGCKWVLLTATPDRSDGQKLVGPLADECWYGDQPGQQVYDFIREGWLVPPKVRHIHIASLQWKWLKGKSGKDFTNEQVSKVWQDYESIQKFVVPVLQECGRRKVLYFCPNVKHAKDVADVINSINSPKRVADYVASYQIDEDGNRSDYPSGRRTANIEDIGNSLSEFQHLANVNVFAEGTNIPILAALAWLRFTKSRPFLAQGVGRVLRVWPGILNGLERATAEARRLAISKSPKPDAIIFDPTKRSGTKLPLAHMIDVLMPGLTEDVRERAFSLINNLKNTDDYDPREMVDEAVRLESPLLKGIRAALVEIRPDIQYKLVDVDPFSGSSGESWSVKPVEQEKKIGDAGDRQKKFIKMLAPKEYSEEFYESLHRKQAGRIIDKLLNDPPVSWILRKLHALGITQIPTTNKQGLDLLKKGRVQA